MCGAPVGVGLGETGLGTSPVGRVGASKARGLALARRALAALRPPLLRSRGGSTRGVAEMRLGSGHTLETPEPRAVALEVRQAACGGLRRSRIPTRPMTTSISVSRHVYRSTTTVPFDHSPSPRESNKRRSCTPPLCIRSSLSCSKAPRIQCCCMGFQTPALNATTLGIAGKTHAWSTGCGNNCVVWSVR